MHPHVDSVLREGQWDGDPVFIIGGGPSLKDLDRSLLDGQRLVGANQSWRFHRDMAVTVICDPRVAEMNVKNHRDEWMESSSVKVLATKVNPPNRIDGCYWISRTLSEWGKSLNQGLYHAKNTGIVAVNLADILGASVIYLLGFDLWEPGLSEYENWHDDYPSGWKPDDHNGRVLGRWNQYWKHAARFCEKIINLTPRSRLDIFPRARIEDVIQSS